jgi:hypothetical protein
MTLNLNIPNLTPKILISISPQEEKSQDSMIRKKWGISLAPMSFPPSIKVILISALRIFSGSIS